MSIDTTKLESLLNRYFAKKRRQGDVPDGDEVDHLLLARYVEGVANDAERRWVEDERKNNPRIDELLAAVSRHTESVPRILLFSGWFSTRPVMLCVRCTAMLVFVVAVGIVGYWQFSELRGQHGATIGTVPATSGIRTRGARMTGLVNTSTYENTTGSGTSALERANP